MDNRSEVREFLRSRRAKITPEQVGLVSQGLRRRVPGLRREEVATLAGVSVDYYTRLEKGNLGRASEAVLDSIACALRLDGAERAHLLDLARTARSQGRPPQPLDLPDSFQHMLDAMVDSAALVLNGRLDVVATNGLARAFFARTIAESGRPANFARFCFLAPSAREFYVDWSNAADVTVEILRAQHGRNPQNRDFNNLVTELTARSGEFRDRWVAHDVRLHPGGTKSFHHPVVGDITLDYNVLPLSTDSDLAMVVYTAVPGSAAEEGLRILASWSAPASGSDSTSSSRSES